MAIAGGFLPYSPAPSSAPSTLASAALPRPRASPLRSGSSKESIFIRFVDNKILRIQRRFAKRENLGPNTLDAGEQGGYVDSDQVLRLEKSEQWHDVPGYKSFAGAARDTEALVGLLWVSGTPSLQVPYLISLAQLVNTMVPAFPASPRQLFRLIGKLDHAFASLLQGSDIETGATLPGFAAGRKVTTTEKVRIKSLIERTRVSVANVVSAGDFEAEEDEDDVAALDTDDDLIIERDSIDGDYNDWNMEVAKVYDNTLQELGDSLDGPAIGIQTEPRR